ncbi:hypothetical protein [Dorea longicatena]|uniref:hypothetical protein n=1 Tax=Dorea longicatena TaxID=88431 RepID=UPI0022E1AB68|nr:hypothetical protein [Dorea longicatena]
MKKEYKLVGKVTIPKKKRKEVKSIIQKILYLGGIREKETIEIDGRQCITAGIPKWNAREVISFNYNMFTNTSYEAGRLYLKAGSIKNPCNHDKEYDFVANLIRVVLESYSTTPCYLCCDNIPCFIVDYARVINEMIRKRLSFPNRNKMWKMYYALHMNGCENIATREILEMARTTEVEESAVEHFLTVLCVGSYEPIVPRNFCRIDKKKFENSFTLNILENIRQSMEELINTEGKEKVFEFLKNLLGKKYAQRKLFAEEDNLYGTVAAGSLYLLPAMLGKTYSLITGEEFWKTWEKLDFGTGYEDIIRPKNDVLPIKGTEEDIEFYRALGKQNEDELMRYKGDKELMLSDNMQNSIERWKRAYGQVTEKEIKKLEMEKALKKLLEDFFYVWNFRVLDTAFVREFLKHKNDDRYKRAMIVLIELMDKETKYFPELTKREANIWLIREIRDADEMIEINAYLGMLRNHLRRKEILGF